MPPKYEKIKISEKLVSAFIAGGWVWLFQYYLNYVEQNNVCYSVIDSSLSVEPQTLGAENVNINFEFLFKIYAWCTIVDVARELCGALWYFWKTPILTVAICIMQLNYIV